MANRQEGYGLSKEVKQAIAAKYDPKEEKDAMEWISKVLGENVYKATGADGVHATLKDGVILCRLMNAIKPGSISKINNSSMAFKQMENINSFLEASMKYGISVTDTFQTVDLYENQNMHQVIMGIHALGRKAQVSGFTGPTLGPKESEKNVRNFSEETLNEGKTVIGLQMGTNKGATQSGQNFGKPRSILD